MMLHLSLLNLFCSLKTLHLYYCNLGENISIIKTRMDSVIINPMIVHFSKFNWTSILGSLKLWIHDRLKVFIILLKIWSIWSIWMLMVLNNYRIQFAILSLWIPWFFEVVSHDLSWHQFEILHKSVRLIFFVTISEVKSYYHVEKFKLLLI